MTQRTTWTIGERHTWSAHGGFAETPADTLDSCGRLVTRIAAALHKTGATEGTVLVDERVARRLGLLDPATNDGRSQRALDSAAQAGWRHSTNIGPWTSFFAKERPSVYIGQLSWLNRAEHTWWPFHAPFPADVVTALQAFHDLTGVAWQAGAPVMGVELMFRTLTSYQVQGQKGRRRPDLRDDMTPDEAGVSMWSPESWHRPSLHPYQHSYDKRRAGITAAGVAKLSPAKLVRGRRLFDPKRAGWWLVTVPPWNVPEMPHPLGPGAADVARRVGGANRLWVTTAHLDVAEELAEAGKISMPDVIDSLTGPARPVLQPFQAAIERAYQAPIAGDYDDVAQGLVRGAVKDAGTTGIGMLNKADGDSSIWRPDWYAGVNATKQCNSWRTAWRIGNEEGRWPIAFSDDAIWYGSDDDDAERAAPRALDLRNDVPGAYRAEATVERIST
jgi:hypothetical protein